MRGKVGCLLWLSLLSHPLLASDRNPFLPPEDRCQAAQLAQWRYGGAIGHPQYRVGYLQDPRGQWRRVRDDASLPAGWRIHLLTAQRLEITTGPGCEPAHWSWLREKGGKHDAMGRPAVSVAASDSGGKK
ncbi:HofP DNA utilization family protein [Klebsiella sp. I138]|uniref:HofP DNA utilization family protein n=1 Tax=Klebsiella sp. I138 TaxID=2755385 RepID=UPI003DA96B3C